MPGRRSIASASLFPGLSDRTAQSKLSRSVTAIRRGIEAARRPAAEESFTLDLFRLLGDEERFDWAVDDLGLALAVFREYTKQRSDSQDPQAETLDDMDGADWWKRSN